MASRDGLGHCPRARSVVRCAFPAVASGKRSRFYCAPLRRSPGTPPSNSWPFRPGAGRIYHGSPLSTHFPRRSASARKWASSAKKTFAPTCCASARSSAYTATKASRLARRPSGNEDKSQPVQQATAAEPEAFLDKPTHHFPVPMPGLWQPSVGPAGPRRGRGGATRLFEAKGRGTSVAEGSDPRADGVGIPFQRLGYRRRSPALGKPESMPPFPLPTLDTCVLAGHLHPVAAVQEVPLCPTYPTPPPLDFSYRIPQLLCGFSFM